MRIAEQTDTAALPSVPTSPRAARHLTPRRTRRRLPRLSSTWKIALIFCAAIVIGNAALDRFGRDLAVASDEWGALGQITACERQSMTPDIVIMGSSRAQAGIAPPVLASEVATRLGQPIVACDMAVTTSVPMQDYYMLRQLLDDGARPKFLIYATADFAFNSSIAEHNPPVLDNMEYVAHLSDLPNIVPTTLGGLDFNDRTWLADFVESRLLRPYADRHGVQLALCQLKPDFGPCPEILPKPNKPIASPNTPKRTYPIDQAQGWFPLPEATDLSLLNSQWQYQAWLSGYQVAPDALDFLGRYVALARHYHIGLILLNTPLLPRHLAFYPHTTDYLKYVDALNQFAIAHDVPFYDEGLGYDDNVHDFADTNHLNYWGAIAFTGWLSAHVIIPEYQRQVVTTANHS